MILMIGAIYNALSKGSRYLPLHDPGSQCLVECYAYEGGAYALSVSYAADRIYRQ